ncbi:MAG: alpha-amylase family glycosyl hydrolase [Propionicimonas sp.]|uniref:alpha-amylase family glycosyl hydrolase n=1 Tax=Propionicimonas sp. TaxID=1955623 RepID=UPI002B1EF229|nr:alpha-amylase family glycosyl hydrolase [Propionicimonas sp.]MEA4943244.1 alpha-amylase family glycosyl hydrolase [Propionicimonas sp.]
MTTPDHSSLRSSGPAPDEPGQARPSARDWTATTIWWQLYPLGFVGAERTPVTEVNHRLSQLLNWLDYVIELGANGLLLNPIFASASHGYDTLDHFRIDPRLGDDADFDRLVAEARRRGIRICLDGVFNHVGRDHYIVQRAIEAGPDTPFGDWIRWSDDGHPWCFEGHEALVELNLANPEVANYVVTVMVHWLDRGIDAWRLDAAYAPGAEVWRPIVDRVHEAHPEAWILGEVIHGPYDEFVTASGVDSVTQYELWHLMFTALKDRNLWALNWALTRHRELCQVFLPLTFLSNHDVTRIASQFDDPRHAELAAVLLMLLPGVPSIYAGDEQGFTGVKEQHEHGDDPVRPQFPDDPSGLLGFGAGLHDRYRELIALRRRHPWLADAEIETSDVDNRWITITLSRDEHRVVLDLNVADDEVNGVAPHSWRLSEG